MWRNEHTLLLTIVEVSVAIPRDLQAIPLLGIYRIIIMLLKTQPHAWFIAALPGTANVQQ